MNYYFLFGPSEAAVHFSSYNNNLVVVRFIVHVDTSRSHRYAPRTGVSAIMGPPAICDPGPIFLGFWGSLSARFKAAGALALFLAS